MKTVHKIDLSNVKESVYKEMSIWCDTYLDNNSYSWHHQPNRSKYWIDFLSISSASMFTLRWQL